MNTQAIARAKQLGVKTHKADSFGRYYLEDIASGQMIGMLQRGRTKGPNGGGVPTWNGWDVSSDLVVDNYPGSMATAIANVIHSSRAIQAAGDTEAEAQMERAIWSAGSDLAYAASCARRAGNATLADTLDALALQVAATMPATITTAAF